MEELDRAARLHRGSYRPGLCGNAPIMPGLLDAARGVAARARERRDWPNLNG
jgi:hypothetical protein